MDNIIGALSQLERQIVFECLCAAEQENFFPEWEFHTLFGITRKQLSAVREKWPEVDTQNEDVGAAVVGAMNNLMGYPHGQENVWSKYISVEPRAVHATLDKLIALGL